MQTNYDGKSNVNLSLNSVFTSIVRDAVTDITI